MKTTILILLLVGISNSVFGGYGCSGKILNRTLNSEYIIRGKIVEIESKMDSSNLDRYSKFEIEIKKVLKGNYLAKTLKVKISDNLFHEIDKIYKNSNDLLIFIYESIEQEKLPILIGGCEFIELKTSEYSVICDRILELMRIGEIENLSIRNKEIINWSIKCMKNSITSYYGAAELSIRGIIYRYNEKKKEYEIKREYKITKKQRNQIRNILFSKDTIEYSDVIVVKTAKKRKRDRVMLRYLAKQFSRSNFEKEVWFIHFYMMQEISLISKNKKLNKIFQEFKKIGIYTADRENLILLAKKFNKEMNTARNI